MHSLWCSLRYIGDGGINNMVSVDAQMVSGWATDEGTHLKDVTVQFSRYEANKICAVQLPFNSVCYIA